MKKRKGQFAPTKADRDKVKNMAAVRIPHDIIARRFGITEEELDQHFERELLTALPEIRAMANASLYASAIAGKLGAVAFWLKTNAGWSETTYLKAREEENKPAKPKKPKFMAIIPCNSRWVCANRKLWIPYWERKLQALLDEEQEEKKRLRGGPK